MQKTDDPEVGGGKLWAKGQRLDFRNCYGSGRRCGVGLTPSAGGVLGFAGDGLLVGSVLDGVRGCGGLGEVHR